MSTEMPSTALVFAERLAKISDRHRCHQAFTAPKDRPRTR
jgi:hypothetical protein